MKKKLKSFFILLVFASCDQTYKLSEEEYSWMPYNGNEKLVFKSTVGEADTIGILKKDTLLAYPEAQVTKGIKYEEVAVFCNSPSQAGGSGNNYYFFKVQKSKDNRAELVFNLSTETAVFYRIEGIKIDSLKRMKAIVLQTSYGNYDDVYVILPGNYAKDYSDRDDFVMKLYWSKSKGLIRYDKKNEVYWELMKY